MYCNVAWCGVVWCGVVWCGVVWCGLPNCQPKVGLVSTGIACPETTLKAWFKIVMETRNGLRHPICTRAFFT